MTVIYSSTHERRDMNIERIEIDWNEDGCDLVLVSDADEWHRFHITDPEQLYDRVKGAIGPWLRERELAQLTRPLFACNPDESAGAYELSDPKHPDHHSVHADIWDTREGK